MEKPIITTLKKGSKLKPGDIMVRRDGVFEIKRNNIANGMFVNGKESQLLAEGFYFRVTWKEEKKCKKN